MAENASLSTVLDTHQWGILMYITLTVIYIVFLLIVAGNALTILAFIKFHSLRKVRNYFLVSLAVGDIFLGLLNLVSLVFMLNPGDYVMIQCDKQGLSILPSISLIVMILSYLHILVITVDCFLCIMKPLHYHQLMSSRRAKIIIGVIWIASFITGGIYLIKEWYAYVCHDTPSFEIYYALIKAVLWIIVVLVVISMYVQIYLIIQKQKRQVAILNLSYQQDDVVTHNRNSNNKRIAMLFMILISFIVLWLPNIIISILFAYNRNLLIDSVGESNTATIIVMCLTFALTNSAVNAFIYARIDKDFRNSYKQIMQCKHGSSQSSG